ncbi:MAG: dTDP-4-dehydrorhamnose reductase [Acaryochloridaceae cyanobacterium SU_2_1]|nr:dTDP-4-dehydrorhamnose reductase [Acaryochloridaceae cyanobacterium SU_2_1]
MPSLLLIGAQGQVGQELQLTLPRLGQLTVWDRTDLDLTKLSTSTQLHQQLASVQPQVIVNAAAYTAVDRAESEPDLADQINARVPALLAEVAQNLGAILVHLSTDYVFDGQQSHPYAETDLPHPQNVYGHSKWRGEEAVRNSCDRHFILRTAWVYGAYGKGNFVKTMLRLGAERSQISVVMDQIGTPTWAKDIADAITALLALAPTANISGTYHFTNSGVASWYDFAVALFAEAKGLGLPLQIEQILPISTAEYPTPAVRPAYSVLSNRKIMQVLGQSAPHWQTSLRQMLQALSSKSSDIQT